MFVSSPKSNLKSITFDEVTLIDCLSAFDVNSSRVDGAVTEMLGASKTLEMNLGSDETGSGAFKLKSVKRLSNLKLVLRSSPPRSNLKEVLTGNEFSL